MTFALFGIENDGLNLAVNLLVFFLVVIWIALVYWTYSDAVRRLDDPLLIGCATVASLFPFIGTIVYTIVRPPEYLEDTHERELEIRAAEKRLALLENRTCRNCGSEVEPSFLRCPTCMRKLKEPCRSCGRPLDPRWRVCPYCEAEVSSAMREERSERRRRSRRTADEQPRVTRASSLAGREEEANGESTATLRSERSVSQPPPER
jgi:Double zinc ribbon